jgi:hypothetical protein
MDSFASELGVPFEIQMEASHVVDMDKQVAPFGVQCRREKLLGNCLWWLFVKFSLVDQSLLSATRTSIVKNLSACVRRCI